MQTTQKNQLYYGDNLTVLREHIKDESVDLIYLDPPPGLVDKHARIQIVSIEELLAAKKIDYPRFAADATFKRAPKSRKAPEEQIPLSGELEEPF